MSCPKACAFTQIGMRPWGLDHQRIESSPSYPFDGRNTLLERQNFVTRAIYLHGDFTARRPYHCAAKKICETTVPVDELKVIEDPTGILFSRKLVC